MTRTTSKKGVKRKSKLHWWLFGFFVLVCTLVFFAYQHQFLTSNPANLKALYVQSSQSLRGFAKIKSWITSRKEHIQNGLVKVKQLTKKNNEEPEIHYEFYTALPNMQINVETPNLQTKETKSELVKVVANSTIVKAEDIEKEISAQLKHNGYVLQLGLFRNANLADQFRKTLAVSGLKASITKVMVSGKKLFRVQLGPFNTKEQVKLAQSQLQKKGLKSWVCLQ